MTKQKASPKPRIVIIGGGIDGCTNAIELAKEKNNEIFIFEQNPEILQGIGIWKSGSEQIKRTVLYQLLKKILG